MEELVLAVWHGFGVGDNDGEGRYWREPEWHDLTIGWIRGFSGGGGGIIQKRWMLFQPVTNPLD
jgi:hypothetical protein